MHVFPLLDMLFLTASSHKYQVQGQSAIYSFNFKLFFYHHMNWYSLQITEQSFQHFVCLQQSVLS